MSPCVIKSRIFSFFFLRLHLWHLEVPRLGVILESQLQACATATATVGLSHICDLHHNFRQHWVLNPLNKARDRNLHPHIDYVGFLT